MRYEIRRGTVVYDWKVFDTRVDDFVLSIPHKADAEKVCNALNGASAKDERIAELLDARKLVERMAEIDYANGDSLCLKTGGDGDNGEYLIELLGQALNTREK